jgi:hypothetical protein
MKKRYMHRSTECIQVKEEDLDWLVYHLLLDDSLQDQDSLAARAGCSGEELAASLARLESSFLIVRSGKGFRTLSIPEFMLVCQSRHDCSAPFTIEGGVIRERKGPGLK